MERTDLSGGALPPHSQIISPFGGPNEERRDLLVLGEIVRLGHVEQFVDVGWNEGIPRDDDGGRWRDF